MSTKYFCMVLNGYLKLHKEQTGPTLPSVQKTFIELDIRDL